MPVDHQYDVMRAPECKKHQDDDENEPYGAMFSYHPCGQDGQSYSEVAVDEYSQRQDEKQHKLLVEAEEFPLKIARVFAHQSFYRILFNSKMDVGFEASEEANNPDDCRQHDGIAGSALFVGYHAMDHGQVAVERHEGEEEDGAVEAQIVGAVHQLTKSFSENPLVGIMNGMEWERKGDNNVGGHQVHKKYIGDRVELFKLVEDEQNHSIAQYASDKDDVVEAWKKIFAEIVDVNGVAHSTG